MRMVALLLSPSKLRSADRLVLAATVLFSIIGVIVLAMVADTGSGRAAVLIYGAALVASSCASFIYNDTVTPGRRRAFLRRIDHAAIFLLIGGTYTPFALGGLAGPFGWSLLAWIWGLCLVGVVLKLCLGARHDRLFVVLYLATGWFVVVSGEDILATLPRRVLVLLTAGGLIYTVGALIYAADRGPWMKPVWHGFVLAGVVTHYVAVLLIVGYPSTE